MNVPYALWSIATVWTSSEVVPDAKLVLSPFDCFLNCAPPVISHFPTTATIRTRFPHSLIQSMKAGQGQLTEGDALETVGVSVSDYVLDEKMTARFYDLAGQADYYGLHQLFLTSRAVYGLTWDASKFMRQTEVMTPVVKK